MNKKEINEIKRIFSDDCGLFTVNHVVTAFVDAEKNIKCKTNQLYNTIPQDEAELIMINLKRYSAVLSAKICWNIRFQRTHILRVAHSLSCMKHCKASCLMRKRLIIFSTS